jgi:hypothetical protein
MQANSSTPADVSALAEETRRLRERMEILRASHQVGQASYEDMAEAARAFCAAFDRYHRAKFGKGKRLDYRYVLRSA